MKLNFFCAVVGPTRSVFEVEIDDAKTVSELKEAVVDQSRGAIAAPYPNLQLFLAKKNDAWLKDGGDLNAVLQSGDVTSYQWMLETLKLNNSNLFGDASRGEDAGPDGSLGEGVIHVLVVLPPEMVITPSPDPGRIVTLNCAIIGTAESAFPVDIGENMSVGHLKDAIWTKQQYQFPAAKLHRFMAKKNNKWLDAAGAAALSLDIHGRPQGYAELMNPLLPLKDDKHFGAGFQPGRGQIQVLVVRPFGVTINIEEGKGNAELKLYQDRGKKIQDNTTADRFWTKSTRYTNSRTLGHFRLFVWKDHRAWESLSWRLPWAEGDGGFTGLLFLLEKTLNAYTGILNRFRQSSIK